MLNQPVSGLPSYNRVLDQNPDFRRGRHDRHRQQAQRGQVCRQIWTLEPTPDNLVHVARLMAKAGIEHYHPIPYPKTHVVRNGRGKLVAAVWLANHPKAGLPVIFEDEAEEAAYHAAPRSLARAFG
jgi:hypothetical protein